MQTGLLIYWASKLMPLAVSFSALITTVSADYFIAILRSHQNDTFDGFIMGCLIIMVLSLALLRLTLPLSYRKMAHKSRLLEHFAQLDGTSTIKTVGVVFKPSKCCACKSLFFASFATLRGSELLRSVALKF